MNYLLIRLNNWVISHQRREEREERGEAVACAEAPVRKRRHVWQRCLIFSSEPGGGGGGGQKPGHTRQQPSTLRSRRRRSCDCFRMQQLSECWGEGGAEEGSHCGVATRVRPATLVYIKKYAAADNRWR